MTSNAIERRPAVWLWIFISFATLLWILPELLRDDLYDGDAAHHVFWAYKYADPTLFPDDFASEYFANPSIVPRGYNALYRALAQILDIQIGSELLGAALFALTLFMAARVGSHVNTQYPAMSGWAMMLLITVAISALKLLPPMGLQRAFALPLTLAAILALMGARLGLLGVVFLLSALFYPIICATLGICTVIYLTPRFVRDRRLPEGWLPLLLLGSIALAVITLRNVPDSIGPMVTMSEALTMPEFGPDGRQRLFGEGLRGQLAHHRTGLGFPLRWCLLSVVVIGFLAWRRRLSAIPGIAWSLLGAAFTVWIIARLTLFTLYLPQRHTVWALPVFLGILTATSVPIVIHSIGYRATRTIMVLTSILALGYYGWGTIDQWQTPRSQDLDAAYAFLETLPSDTLVAAYPVDANDVPMRSRRSVLVSRETSISFMLGYYGRASERIQAALDATYATDWSTVDSLGSRWGVDVFLVTANPWEQIGYDEPFNSRVMVLIQKGQSEGFVLRDPPADRVMFQSGNVLIVRVE